MLCGTIGLEMPPWQWRVPHSRLLQERRRGREEVQRLHFWIVFEGNSRSVAGYEPPSLALLLPALPLLPSHPSAHHPEGGGHPPAVARDGPARVELPEAGGVRGVGLGAPDGLALTVHQGAPTVEAVALEGDFFLKKKPN